MTRRPGAALKMITQNTLDRVFSLRHTRAGLKSRSRWEDKPHVPGSSLEHTGLIHDYRSSQDSSYSRKFIAAGAGLSPHHLTVPLCASHGAQQTALFLFRYSRVAAPVAVSGKQGELVWQLFSQLLERVKPVRVFRGRGRHEHVRGYRYACRACVQQCASASACMRKRVCLR